MTTIATRQDQDSDQDRDRAQSRATGPVRSEEGKAGRSAPRARPVCVGRPGGRVVGGHVSGGHDRRRALARPAGAPLRYGGTGVTMSRAPHRRRPITPVTTVVLALLAAGFTVWLGLVAHVGGVVGPVGAVPEKLVVVRVQAGETLQHVAARVAPDAPLGDVVSRIRELNSLNSAAVDTGQTLIAPIG